MKIFEKQPAYIYKTKADLMVIKGAWVVFGEGGNMKERYFAEIGLEQLGYGPLEWIDSENRTIEEVCKRVGDVDLKELKASAQHLLLQDLLPRFDAEKFTEAAADVRNDAFFKGCMLIFAGLCGSANWRKTKSMSIDVIANEAVMRAPQCPYISKYLGCRVEGDLITGLYFEKYKRLSKQPKPWDVEKYVGQIRLAIEHLHSLRLCHNNVNPRNIMLGFDDTAILINLDSCLPFREKQHKLGEDGFSQEEEKYSDVVNDWLGLQKIEEYMYRENGNKKARETSLLNLFLKRLKF